MIDAVLYPGHPRRRSKSQPAPTKPKQPVFSGHNGVGATSVQPQPGTRASLAGEYQAALDRLMTTERLRFPDYQRPVVHPPSRPASGPLEAEQWRRRKSAVPFWRLDERRALRAQIQHEVASELDRQHAHACEVARHQQADADRWWQAMVAGDPRVVFPAMSDAFVRSGLPVRVTEFDRRHATLVICIPGPEVLPPKLPHITPTGQWSIKNWPTTEFNSAYSRLLAGHLLAATRLAFTVSPAVQKLTMIGLRQKRTPNDPEVYFDIDVDRRDTDWNLDTAGLTLLQTAPRGLNIPSRGGKIGNWPLDSLPAETQRALGLNCGA